MSSFTQVQKCIGEITDELYPAIDVIFHKISTFKKNVQDADDFENALDIFGMLKEEIHSLKNYELKLVFPGINRYFGEEDMALPQNLHITELHELLKKKEECVKNKVLDLEVELEENDNNPLGELVKYFKEHYFCRKDAFYRGIAKLQKERAVKSNDSDILAPDSLAI